MLSLNHLAVLVNKRFYDELHKDMFKFLIASPDGENGLITYFREWCSKFPGGKYKPVPVFSENPHDAARFETVEEANEAMQKIHEDYPHLHLVNVKSIWTRQKHGLRMIHGMLGWPEDREPNDVLEDELFFSRTMD